MMTETMNAVVIVAICILATIFLASLVALILVCKHRYCKPVDLISRQHLEHAPEVTLVENMEGPVESLEPGMAGVGTVELGEVALNPTLQQILQDESWVSDATGLVPHCLEILRTCHTLTEKMVGMTMRTSHALHSSEEISDLAMAARRIGPRVDEVVSTMYPPLDPRLLEARCTALVLSVSHLVMVAKNACQLTEGLEWVDQALATVEEHLKVLHYASVQYDAIHQQLQQQQAIAAANQTQQQPALQQLSVELSPVYPPPHSQSSQV